MREPPTNICPLHGNPCIEDRCAAPWLALRMQPPNWPMSGRSSQRKGRAAELELSRVLQDYGYPVEAGRAQSYGEVPDLSGLPGVHIECKRAEALRLSEWMEQARRDAERFRGWCAHRILSPFPLALVCGDGAGGLDADL